MGAMYRGQREALHLPPHSPCPQGIRGCTEGTGCLLLSQPRHHGTPVSVSSCMGLCVHASTVQYLLTIPPLTPCIPQTLCTPLSPSFTYFSILLSLTHLLSPFLHSFHPHCPPSLLHSTTEELKKIIDNHKTVK